MRNTVIIVLAALLLFQTVRLDKAEQTLEEMKERMEALEDSLAQSSLKQKQLEVFSEEDLWLARAVYSETKNMYEMELVAWVIRNRVETRYRGKTTYRGVVLDPFQFSAFNTEAGRRRLERLTPAVKERAWRQALRIAHYVRRAPAEINPLPGILHYYSPVSMKPKGAEPHWASVGEEAFRLGDRFVFLRLRE